MHWIKSGNKWRKEIYKAFSTYLWLPRASCLLLHLAKVQEVFPLMYLGCVVYCTVSPSPSLRDKLTDLPYLYVSPKVCFHTTKRHSPISDERYRSLWSSPLWDVSFVKWALNKCTILYHFGHLSVGTKTVTVAQSEDKHCSLLTGWQKGKRENGKLQEILSNFSDKLPEKIFKWEMVRFFVFLAIH